MSSFHHAACFHASAFVPKYSLVCESNANHADIDPKEPPFIALDSTCFLEVFSCAGTQIAIHPKSPIPGAFLRWTKWPRHDATCIKYHDHEISLSFYAKERAKGWILDFDGDLGDDQDIWPLFLMFHVLPGRMTSTPRLTTQAFVIYSTWVDTTAAGWYQL